VSKHIVIVAGEASGDLHGSNLVEEIKKKDSSITFSGMGGKYMETAGVDLVADIEETGVVGLWEVLFQAKSLFKTYIKIKSHLKKTLPDLFLPVDYPDFNLRMSKIAKKSGIPVVYYISPQLWAWRTGRINIIRKCIDRMLVILPFEKDYYSKFGVDVNYVGHPLVDSYSNRINKQDARNLLNINRDQVVISIMPGSRKSEIDSLIQVIQSAVEIIGQKYITAIFPLLLAPTLHMEDLANAGFIDNRIIVHTELHKEILAASDVVITASGTATIDVTLSEIPMVIIYKVSPVTFWIAKRIIRTPHIGMVNLIASEPVVPELLQDQVTPENIARETCNILDNVDLQTRIQSDLSKITKKLGPPGAAGRAAENILGFLNQQPVITEYQS